MPSFAGESPRWASWTICVLLVVSADAGGPAPLAAGRLDVYREAAGVAEGASSKSVSGRSWSNISGSSLGSCSIAGSSRSFAQLASLGHARLSPRSVVSGRCLA